MRPRSRPRRQRRLPLPSPEARPPPSLHGADAVSRRALLLPELLTWTAPEGPLVRARPSSWRRATGTTCPAGGLSSSPAPPPPPSLTTSEEGVAPPPQLPARAPRRRPDRHRCCSTGRPTPRKRAHPSCLLVIRRGRTCLRRRRGRRRAYQTAGPVLRGCQGRGLIAFFVNV